MKEINDIPGKDVRGNCAVWRIWYVHTRLANPHINRKDLILMASRKLENIGSFYKFIKSYQLYLLSAMKNKKQSKKATTNTISKTNSKTNTKTNSKSSTKTISKSNIKNKNKKNE